MWPIDAKLFAKQLKIFHPDPSQIDPPLLLPCQTHPQEVGNIEHGLVKEVGPKIQKDMQWRYPICADEFNSFITNSKEILTESMLKEQELEIWHQRRDKELHSRFHSRKQLRPKTGGLGLTKEDAETALAMKLQKEKEAEKKRR